MSLLLDALKKAAEAKNRQEPVESALSEEQVRLLEEAKQAELDWRKASTNDSFPADPPYASPQTYAPLPSDAQLPLDKHHSGDGPPVMLTGNLGRRATDVQSPPVHAQHPSAPKHVSGTEHAIGQASQAEEAIEAVGDTESGRHTPISAPIPTLRREREQSVVKSRGQAGGAASSTATEPLYDEFDETQQLDTDELRAELLSSTHFGSREHARAVLGSSHASRKPLRQRPSVLLILLGLVALVGVGGLLYFSYGERDFELQRELASIRSRAPISVPAEPPRSLEKSEPASGGVADGSELAEFTETDIVGAAAVSEQPTLASAQAVQTPAAVAEGSGRAAVVPITEPPSAPTEPAATASPVSRQTLSKPASVDNPPSRAAPVSQPLSEAQPVESGQLSIAHRQQVAPLDVLLQQGYDAYQAGRFYRSPQKNADALQLDDNNRDALLGAAAVAQRSRETSVAASLYQRLLQLDPRDPAALVGLQALGRQADPQRFETELRKLLAQTPDNAALNYALGNVYSGQQRWAEAQQAYFDALGLDPDNPDYLYNVAVSLDYLGKSSPAADFYRQALQASRSRAASFDQAAALARLNLLEEGTR